MNQDGYTLTEMLAALVMLGLAIGGLTQGVRVIGLVQASAARSTQAAQTLRSAQQSLGRLLATAGPFSTDGSNRLTGSGQAFDYDCGSGRTCGAVLKTDHSGTQLAITGLSGAATVVRLPGVSDAQFTYGGDRSAGAAWPPAAEGRDRLRWLAVVREPTQIPLLSVRLWVEQSPGCRFDVIAQDCRSVAR